MKILIQVLTIQPHEGLPYKKICGRLKVEYKEAVCEGIYKIKLEQLIDCEVHMRIVRNIGNAISPRQAYQEGHNLAKQLGYDYVIYSHDDVIIEQDNWLKVISEFLFNNPKRIGVVGLGGSNNLGGHMLYKRRYALNDMARSTFQSCLKDWMTHGSYLKKIKNVAVVDAFLMVVSSKLLDRCEGWPDYLTHHCLDLYICCQAARHNYDVVAMPIPCQHLGGLTSTKPAYKNAKWLIGGTLEEDHQQPHRILYDRFRDVLPIRINDDSARN